MRFFSIVPCGHWWRYRGWDDVEESYKTQRPGMLQLGPAGIFVVLVLPSKQALSLGGHDSSIRFQSLLECSYSPQSLHEGK